jgi:predicted transcriptional regulator
MSTLTIRMPDATHARLRDLAQARGVSMNKLIEEMATATARGRPERALAILDRLDATDRAKGMAEAKRPFRAKRGQRTNTK